MNMRDAFGNEVTDLEIEKWRIPGLWWIQVDETPDLSENRSVPGVRQLDDRYWGRIAKISDDWRQERNAREINTTIDASHLQLGLTKERVTTELESTLKKVFPILEWICELPETEIRLEDLKLPVDRSRRMAKGALAHLASHSEDWLRVTTRGPLPKRIVSSIREEDLTIYENRLVRTVLDRSILHLGRLIDAIRKDEKARIALKVTKEFHLKRKRISESLGVESRAESVSQIADRREVLEELRNSLLSLRQSALGQATNDIQRVTELHVTNLLANEQRYREMVPLWEALRVFEGSLERGIISLHDVWLNRQEDLIDYRELLVVRSLQFMGAKEVGAQKWRLAGIDIELENANGCLSLHLSRGRHSTESLFIGLLGISLGANSENVEDRDSLQQIFSFLGDEKRLKGKKYILLHTTDPNDVTDMMNPIALSDPFAPTPHAMTWFGNGGLLPLAVHPLALDSAERLGRVLSVCLHRYWANTNGLSFELPGDFQNVPSADFDLEGTNFTLEGGSLVAQDWDIKAPSLSQKSKSRPNKAIDYRKLNALIHQSVENLLVERDELFVCPLFPNDHGARGRENIFWDHSGFRFECKECDVRWGVRVCAKCGSKTPTLNSATDQDWATFDIEGDMTPASYLGINLWSNFCEKSRDVYICTVCTECPRSSSESSCQRCALQARLRATN
jgi:hypothetical protein